MDYSGAKIVSAKGESGIFYGRNSISDILILELHLRFVSIANKWFMSRATYHAAAYIIQSKPVFFEICATFFWSSCDWNVT